MEATNGGAIRASGLGALAVLPDHIINMALLNLDPVSLARLICTSKVLRVLGCEEPLWQQLCLRLELPSNYHLQFQGNWRQTTLLLMSYSARNSFPIVDKGQKSHTLTAESDKSDYAMPKWIVRQSATSPSKADATATQPQPCPIEYSIKAAVNPAPPVPIHSDFLYRRWLRCHMNLSNFIPIVQGVERADAKSLTPQQFRQRYDHTCTPMVLTAAMEDWPQGHGWSFPDMVKQYGSSLFSVSKPGIATGRCSMQLSDYWDYARRQADEEPLYIFDPDFVDAAPGIREAYHIPGVFDQDFFSVLGSSRPPYRWLVAGPARSGASWHVDPKLTSAWNALCSGRKRWALYPPGKVPPGVQLIQTDPDSIEPDDAFTSLQWYLEVYPCLASDEKPIEFVQEPGEVVYVPGGWWHMVLNLEDSVAVTQNFVSEGNLDRVICYMAYGSTHYYSHLAHYHPPEQLKAWGVEIDSEEEESEWETDEEDEEEECGTLQGINTAGSNKDTIHDLHLGHSESIHTVSIVLQDSDIAMDPSSINEPANKATNGGLHSDQTDVENDNQQPISWIASDGLPVIPWQRDRQLGRWLARLLTVKPDLEASITAALRTHTGLSFWQQALTAIRGATQSITQQQRQDRTNSNGKKTANGLMSTDIALTELLPYVGADSLVFIQSNGQAVKIVTEEAKPVAGLMYTLEASVPSLLQLTSISSENASSNAVDATSQNIKGNGTCGIEKQTSCAPVTCPLLGQGVLEVQSPANEVDSTEQHEAGNSNGVGVPNKSSANQTDAPMQPTNDNKEVYPYIIMQDISGSDAWAPLKSVWPLSDVDNNMSLAAELGRSMAALHIRGYVAACLNIARSKQHNSTHILGTQKGLESACGTQQNGASNGNSQQQPFTWDAIVRNQCWWHDWSGNVWTSQHGWLVKDGEVNTANENAHSHGNGNTAHCNGSNKLAQVSNALDSMPDQLRNSMPGTAQQGLCCNGDSHDVSLLGGTATTAAWQPFLSFLQHRRSVAVEEIDMTEPVPESILKQVESFLPQDTSVLLGTAQPDTPPLLLHADLTINNIWVAKTNTAENTRVVPREAAAESTPAQRRRQLMLLDWGDAGYGDPLYDFVSVHSSIFQFNPALLQACWMAYQKQIVEEAKAVASLHWHHVEGCSGSGIINTELQKCLQTLAACDSSEHVLRMLWPSRHGVKQTQEQATAVGTETVNGGLENSSSADWSVSKTAMAYCLLHEDTRNLAMMLHQCRKHTEVTKPDLNQLCEIVWGPLDVLSTRLILS